MSQKYIFLDRDGVINKDTGYVHLWKDFSLIEGVIEAFKILKKLGYKFIIVTNQSGIGRGLFTEKQYLKLTSQYRNYFLEYGIEILDIYYCPHSPTNKNEQGCFCRKPNPGMLLKAVKDHNIPLSSSIMVGDNISDMIAAKNAGIEKRILLKGNLNPNENSHSSKIFKNLYEFAKYLDLKSNS